MADLSPIKPGCKMTSLCRRVLVIHRRYAGGHNVQSSVYFWCPLSTSERYRAGYKIQDNIRDCYSLLNIPQGCSMDELKEAYFKMAKLYHPDSQSTTADPKKFDQVKEAYRAIKKKIVETNSATRRELDDDDDDVFDFRAPQPQHRQYLNNEGFGYGSASQRQKQYQQFRVNRVQENVLKYKMEKMIPGEDNALLIKDQKAAKKTKIRQTKPFNYHAEDMLFVRPKRNSII